MWLTDKRREQVVELQDLEPGDSFVLCTDDEIDEEPFILVSHEDDNTMIPVVSLETGTLSYLVNTASVLKLYSKLLLAFDKEELE